MADYIDVEQAMCEVLSLIGDNYTVATGEAPRPHNQVDRTGGASTRWEDQAFITVTVVCSTRDESVQLDKAVSALISDARGVATPSGLIDKISPSNAPMPVPYPSATDDREITSTWLVTSRIQ